VIYVRVCGSSGDDLVTQRSLSVVVEQKMLGDDKEEDESKERTEEQEAEDEARAQQIMEGFQEIVGPVGESEKMMDAVS
jgi:hypothetical protein